jgi:uncharacterized repeat protein (TIGR03803 family)
VNRKMFFGSRLGGIAAICAALLRNTRKTGSISSAPPRGLASSCRAWWRAFAPFALLMSTVPMGSAGAQTATILHNFTGADGEFSYAGLIRDSAGNLYGTTTGGGSAGQGTVFKIPAGGGALTVLHSFGDGTVANDGETPFDALILDAAGNLYGTTYSGGASNVGTAFKIPAGGGPLTVLHSFSWNEGAYPRAGLILDSSGNLYGTTTSGGSGYGTVFKMPAAGGTLTVLHRFGDGTVANDGVVPFGGLILDASGNLYGTTPGGGSSTACNGGCGTVFKIDTAGTLTVLHSFGDGTVANDGQTPYAGLLLDSSGNLYGTTPLGGSANDGTIFKMPAAGGTLTVLHNFGDGTVANDGANPVAGLLLDSSGNLYGTTYDGGVGYGMVFKMSRTGGAVTVLHSFGDGTVANDGINPSGGLVLDPSGNFYSTTVTGGANGDGTVFEILTTPQAATQMIINQVNALSAQKVINSGQRNSLLAELQQAISLMNKGKNASAIQNLQGFISEVRGLESSRVLASSQAEPLISEANGVIAQLR